MYRVSIEDERIRTLLPVHLITVGTGHIQEPRRRPSGALFHHVLYVEQGKGRFETPSGSVILPAGSAVFIRKGCPSFYECAGESFVTAWATFDGPQADAILEYFCAEDFMCRQSEAVHSMLIRCAHLAERGAAPEQLSKEVYELLLTFFSRVGEEKQSVSLHIAKEYMETHFAEDLSVAQIAQAAGISESLLYRLFHDQERLSPNDYLRSVRIRHAKQLLLTVPPLHIFEVATLCGFSDTAYFCKVFRHETNMTPKAYQTHYSV